MSIREQLVRSLSMILRLSKSTLQVLLADENGLSIAKVSRSSDIQINPNAINSVSAATYNFSEEIWEDLGILHQRIALAFFEKFCLITIQIDPVILTIAHDFNASWPLNAEELGKIIYQLKVDIDEMFNTDEEGIEDLQAFSTAIRNIFYLFNMGGEIPFMSYLPEEGSASPEVHDQISHILDSVQNPVFARYSIVDQNGLMIDGRDLVEGVGSSISSFSASTIVAFQKLIEESSNLNAGHLLNFVCISGSDAETLYGILASPAGVMNMSDSNGTRQIKSDLALVSLFPLTYGMVPVFCETRNIAYSMINLLGEDQISNRFLESVQNLISVKYE
ncbi:hypothetical protein GF325_18810 [Candidatus Bathyarchaeota archaeon]|nr:hypothetical protein [Candidatus Bathyarchaeota archaeon]